MFYCVPLKEKQIDAITVAMRPHSDVPFYEVHTFPQGHAVIFANSRPATARDDIMTEGEILDCAASHVAWWIIYEGDVPEMEVNP